MKIAIATNDWKTISSQFYKSKGFAIFDIEGNKIKSQEYHSNTFDNFERKIVCTTNNSNKLTIILNILKDCNIVIFCNIEKKTYVDLKRIGINVFDTEETNVKTILDFFLMQNKIKS